MENESRGEEDSSLGVVDEMETIAARHGSYLAPLYNGDGPLEKEFEARWSRE
jgi:hypothetical protein